MHMVKWDPYLPPRTLWIACRCSRVGCQRAKLSDPATGQTLRNFAFQSSVERSRIETLATCKWGRDNRTPLFQGPPGR